MNGVPLWKANPHGERQDVMVLVLHIHVQSKTEIQQDRDDDEVHLHGLPFTESQRQEQTCLLCGTTPTKSETMENYNLQCGLANF